MGLQHRAVKDLERPMELDLGRRELHQEEIRRWARRERGWQRQAEPRWKWVHRKSAEKKRQEEGKEEKGNGMRSGGIKWDRSGIWGIKFHLSRLEILIYELIK